MDRIIAIASRHLAADGAAALSLRAVARELGVVSSAIYRYVPNRDALLTLLVVDGYDQLADSVDAALATDPGAAPLERCRIVAGAFRAWGLAEPARFGLIFGTPIPGYEAPRETVSSGTRVIVTLLAALSDGVADGSVAVDRPVGEAMAAQLARIRTDDEIGAVAAVPDPVLAAGVGLWGQLVGTTTLEVFGWYGADSFTEPGALFDDAIDRHLDGLRAG